MAIKAVGAFSDACWSMRMAQQNELTRQRVYSKLEVRIRTANGFRSFGGVRNKEYLRTGKTRSRNDIPVGFRMALFLG